MRSVLSVFYIVAVFSLLTATAKADVMNSTPNSVDFILTGWKDNNKVQGIKDSFGNLAIEDAFQFTFAKSDSGASLIFDFGKAVYDQGLQNLVGGIKDTLKFKEFKLEGFTDMFVTPYPTNWDNGGWAKTSIDLTFANGNDWDSFINYIQGDEFTGYISAHIQSIGAAGASINEGKFTLDGRIKGESTTTTPEPATLLILGLGLVGSGFVARRRVSK